jgi:hypothetical protein
VWSVECFPALNFVKICPPKEKWCPQAGWKSTCLTLVISQNCRFIEKQQVFRGSWMVCGKNELNLHSAALNAVFPQQWPLWSHIPMDTKVYHISLWF